MDRIKEAFNRRTDAHDRALIRGDITLAEYEALKLELAEWAEKEREAIRRLREE